MSEKGATEAVDVEAVLETIVRCTEIDVNGHVNNAKFVEYLEWGREEWYERHGFAYDRLEGLGAVTVVANIELNFRQACHQGDRLRIVTWPQRRGRTSFALAQRILRSDGPVVAKGSSPLSPSTRRRAAPYRCQRSSPGCSRPVTERASRYLHARSREMLELLPASGVRWLLPALPRFHAPFVVLVEHG